MLLKINLQTESWKQMGGGKSVPRAPVNQKTSLILSICTRTVSLKYSFRLHINYVTHRTILLADTKMNCASNILQAVMCIFFKEGCNNI
jgi:hypothetical protein